MMILSRTPSARIFYLGLLFAAWIVASQPVMLIAQVSPAEHASHHPSQAGTGAPDVGAGPVPAKTSAAMGGGMEGMGKMMEGMGKAPPKELYPSLMALPELSPEQRKQVEEQAGERMHAGTALMAQALDTLNAGAQSGDYAAMQEAMTRLREGAAQLESGIAARRALAEGRAPREVALTWFKREMNLTSRHPARRATRAPRRHAISPLHDGAAHRVRAGDGRHVLLQDAPRGGPLWAYRGRQGIAAAGIGTAACRTTRSVLAGASAGRRGPAARRTDLPGHARGRNTSGIRSVARSVIRHPSSGWRCRNSSG